MFIRHYSFLVAPCSRCVSVTALALSGETAFSTPMDPGRSAVLVSLLINVNGTGASWLTDQTPAGQTPWSPGHAPSFATVRGLVRVRTRLVGRIVSGVWHSCKKHRCENKKTLKKHVLYPITRGQSNLTKSASRGPIPWLGVTPGGRKLYH